MLLNAVDWTRAVDGVGGHVFLAVAVGINVVVLVLGILLAVRVLRSMLGS